MSRGLKRIGVAILLLVWLVLLLTPGFAFVLARSGQIQLGDAGGRHWRVFLVQSAEAEGIGLERAAPIDPPATAGQAVNCLRTTVSYWTWAGEANSVAYCQCRDVTTGLLDEAPPPVCQTP